MFVAILVGLLLAAALHFAVSAPRSRERAGRLLVLYLLVGYCGLPMAWVAIRLLLDPTGMAADFGLETSRQMGLFFGWAYLGMALLGILAGFYRNHFAAAAAVLWIVYFAGATLVHLDPQSAGGAASHSAVLAILLSHGLIAVLLLGGLGLSGWWRPRRITGAE